MKKTLLIAAGLMSLSLPVQAAQISQVEQAEQATASQQVKPIQTETNAFCIRLPSGRFYCYF